MKKKAINPNRWTAAEISQNIQTNDMWLYRALKALYAHQTDEEQAAGLTKVDNGVGFNAVDSFILTEFAKQLNAKGWLSPRQRDIARTKLRKYSKQIAAFAKEKPRGIDTVLSG